jgi:hypothetical protein
MVRGCDDAEAMEAWGEANGDWLATFLELPHGTPSQDVFLAVFAALEPKAFNSVFAARAQLLTLRLAPGSRHLAVDGKTSRRSFDSAKNRPAIHTVSAWLSNAGLVLGQQQTGEKSNEITAIPELLRTLDLQRATVTIDAIGCRTEVASTITAGGGDYLLAVKDNQPTLRQDIETTMTSARDERCRSRDELHAPVCCGVPCWHPCDTFISTVEENQDETCPEERLVPRRRGVRSRWRLYEYARVARHRSRELLRQHGS